MASQMMVNQTTFLVKCIVICLCLKSVLTLKECKTISVCSCSTDEGEISLRKLAATGEPRFPDIPSASGQAFKYMYSWNPCNPYSLSDTDCKDVAACAQNKDTNKYYGIAKQNTATCALDKNGECTLKYTGTAVFGAKTRLTVTLHCDQAEEGKVVPMNSTLTQDYGTVLHSKYCCPSSSSNSSRLSLGSILVITFSCILIAYIIGGILLNKYARNIEVKEAFPNYSFWVDFPYLIKDGCVFTFHSLRRLCGKGSSDGYASI